MTTEHSKKDQDPSRSHEENVLKLELERLRLERSKLAIETRLKRRELRRGKTKNLREIFANPLLLAIVGGCLTLLTSIVTNYLTSEANRVADNRRANEARVAESRALQSELIKTFLKTQDSKTARDNLKFLIESGLIPDHENRIKEYLSKNKKTVPKIANSIAPTSQKSDCPPLNIKDKKDLKAGNEPVGVSLHLGLNKVDPNSYGGWDGKVLGAELDARAMQNLAKSLGYRTNLLIDSSARFNCLVSALSRFSETLRPGDTLLLTMSGHGGQQPDTDDTEPDGLIELWVFYDQEITAIDLYKLFARFKSDVTIIVVQDNSNSAVFRRPLNMPKLRANLIVFAASREGYTAMQGPMNGLFTTNFLSVWNDGQFTGSYKDLMEAIREKMPPRQVPQMYTYSRDLKILTKPAFHLNSSNN